MLVPMPAGAARRQLPARNGELPPPIFEAEVGEAPRHLRDYLSVLHKYRWLAVACFGVTVGLTILVTLLTPRLYTASTRLQVARQSPIQMRLDGNVIRVPDGERDANGVMTFVSAQAAALKSRDLAERVIREHGLATNEAFLDPRPRRHGPGVPRAPARGGTAAGGAHRGGAQPLCRRAPERRRQRGAEDRRAADHGLLEAAHGRGRYAPQSPEPLQVPRREAARRPARLLPRSSGPAEAAPRAARPPGPARGPGGAARPSAPGGARAAAAAGGDRGAAARRGRAGSRGDPHPLRRREAQRGRSPAQARRAGREGDRAA